ncbi:hypothetical protein [Arthrobacter sp. A5]|uniref:hypothetical protein n=1 Tax=Arthrobacter sp. A5 TaxID=576926 RepID=UPI003DA9CF31
MHQHLANFTGDEGILFISRAGEDEPVPHEKRHSGDGRAYQWILRTTGVFNHFYVSAAGYRYDIAILQAAFSLSQTRAHDRLLCIGLAQLTTPESGPLQEASRNYQRSSTTSRKNLNWQPET